MKEVAIILLSGIAMGSVYCVFALGLSLVYGTSRVLNFAHGSLYMLGAYIAWSLSVGYLHLPYPLMFLVLIPILFVIGATLELAIIRPLRSRANWKIIAMMITLGLAFVIDNFNLIVFGPEDKDMIPLVSGYINWQGINVSFGTLANLGVAIAIVIGLEWFLKKNRYGQAMRAVAQDSQGAAMVGINANRIFMVSFGLSAVLAGVAGVLLAPTYLISPLGGWPPFLKAFVIVVLGGLGSTRGTLYAALILGLVESVVTATIGPTWIMIVWLLTLLAVLLVRPRGFLGQWAE